MQDTAVRFTADSPDELLRTATQARVGDRARVTTKGRTVVLELKDDGGPMGRLWEELRE